MTSRRVAGLARGGNSGLHVSGDWRGCLVIAVFSAMALQVKGHVWPAILGKGRKHQKKHDIAESCALYLEETCCTQSWPFSLYSRGGKMALRISSVCCCAFFSMGGSLPPRGGVGTGASVGSERGGGWNERRKVRQERCRHGKH